MDVTESHQIASASAPPPAAEHGHCGECGAAVDRGQRYCVDCGARQRDVPDPAARYFSRAGARPGAAGARRSPSTGSRLTPGLGLAVLLAVIPVAVAIGVAVGRSSNNQDAKLIRELSRVRVQTTSASAATATGASATTGATSGATAKTVVHGGHGGARKRTSKPAGAGHGRRTTATSSGASKAPSSINGPPSHAQQQQGKKIVGRLQHTTGTGFLNQLPSQVSVP